MIRLAKMFVVKQKFFISNYPQQRRGCILRWELPIRTGPLSTRALSWGSKVWAFWGVRESFLGLRTQPRGAKQDVNDGTKICTKNQIECRCSRFWERIWGGFYVPFNWKLNYLLSRRRIAHCLAGGKTAVLLQVHLLQAKKRLAFPKKFKWVLGGCTDFDW